MTTPLISIGMPMFNGEKYIREALDSILAQSMGDFELIISDNYSTDGSADICEEYVRKDVRVRYIKQLSNIGALANFEFVRDNTIGKYFMWAACDDYWDEHWLQALMNGINTEKTQAAFGCVRQVDENSKLIAHIVNGKMFYYNKTRIFRRIKFFLDFEGAGKANLFYSLFERSFLDRLPIKSYAHDYHAIFDFLDCGKISGIPDVAIYKRIHNLAASSMEIGENRGLLRKMLLRVFFPVDASFLRGYLRLASGFEWFLLIILMPIKYIVSYAYLVGRLRDAVHSK